MSRLFSGTDQQLLREAQIVDASAVESTPVSFACWIKRSRTSHSAEEALMSAGILGGNNSLLRICVNTDNTVTARTRTTSNANSTSTGTITDTTGWHLVVGVFASTTSRTVYLDGTGATPNTDSRDPTGTSTGFTLGAHMETSATKTLEFAGRMAYATVWNKALSAGEVTSLWNGGAGVDPTTVAGANLVAHWDLTGNESPELDDVNAHDLTVVGATFSSDNPFTVGGGGEDFTLPVDANFGVFEASVIALFGPAAVLPVTPSSAVFEPQQLPFILAQAGQHGEAVFEGQDIILVTPNSFTLPVVETAGVFAGQAISLSHTQNIAAAVAFAVFAGQDIGLRIPFVTGGGKIKPRELRGRAFIRLLGR